MRTAQITKGMRVVCVRAVDNNPMVKNAYGKVWEPPTKDEGCGKHSVGVRFDNAVDGHDLGMQGRTCKYGHGWYVHPRDLREATAS